MTLEQQLQYQFARSELLEQALTHKSYHNENRENSVGHNERLEFLGDRVLGLVMAEALLAADRGASEGQLAPRFNALVRKETCADVAREIDLGADTSGRLFALTLDAKGTFDRLVEEDPATRRALGRLCQRAQRALQPALVIINNNAEGCAPRSIAAVVAWMAEHPE